MTKLNKDTLDRLRPAIVKTWYTIASDIYDAAAFCDSEVTNENAIETILDADNLATNGEDKEANMLVNELCKDNSVNDVIKFLSDNIQLI